MLYFYVILNAISITIKEGEFAMDKSEILAKVDHTLLTQTAVWDDIKQICDDAMHFRTASVCIPPSYVKKAREYTGDRMAICTVIGFPNGYNTTDTKVYEAKNAINDGADEIDMVINLGLVKQHAYDLVLEEIETLRAACPDRILKVIVETCLLTVEEKIRMCDIVTRSGADFIKTSTGFSKSGATFEDVELFSKHVGSGVRIKAAGGISSFEDAQRFIELGALRLGTSRLVKLLKNQEGTGY